VSTEIWGSPQIIDPHALPVEVARRLQRRRRCNAQLRRRRFYVKERSRRDQIKGNAVLARGSDLADRSAADVQRAARNRSGDCSGIRQHRYVNRETVLLKDPDLNGKVRLRVRIRRDDADP
jgi:hypothetical protein